MIARTILDQIIEQPTDLEQGESDKTQNNIQILIEVMSLKTKKIFSCVILKDSNAIFLKKEFFIRNS